METNIETTEGCFDPEEWIHTKRTELANLIFKHCLNIDDFTQAGNYLIKYEFIQSPEFSIKLDNYKSCLQLLFGSSIIRSLMNYASVNKRNSVNIIKQLLKYFGYKLYSLSEYQCLMENGKKKYNTFYVIKKMSKETHCVEDSENTQCDSLDEKKIKINLKINTNTK